MKPFYTLVLCLLGMQVFATAPTLPASNLSFNQIDGGFFNIGWTPGNGARRVIIAKAGSAVTFRPQNGIDYTENTTFGSGQQVAPGEYVVYDNAFTSFFLTNLQPGTQYFFAIFEYNGTGAATEYLTSSFLAGNAFTSAVPTVQTSNASFSNITTNSVVVNWTKGNGQRTLIVVREGSAVNADPVNSTPYSVNSVFGSGAAIGTGNFTVYNSSSVGTSVTNLKPGTQYFFAFYEFNGSSQPQYLKPAYTSSVTTRSIPTVASSNVVISKRDGKELTVSWTNGNGQRRIIVAKQGSDITGTPANGTDYAANPVFGTGPTIAAGEYVVYDDNFNSAVISGLNPNTSYFFRIYEYDGTGTNTTYLTSSFGSVSGLTAATPTVQVSNITAGNITSSSMLLQFTPGNGRSRLVIARKGAAVNVVPQNFTAYALNDDLGNGNFVAAISTDGAAGIGSLQAGSQYHFAIFEFNGFNQPLYLSPAATFSATTSGSLPVKLTDWGATYSSGKVLLNWGTAQEVNASHFLVERSIDGVNFQTLVRLEAKGNSSVQSYYQAEDKKPFNGRSYYRLKMVDLDGTYSLSAIKTIVINDAQPGIIQNTLVRESIMLRKAAGNELRWSIVNSAGQQVKNGLINKGQAVLPVGFLSPGKYWIRFDDTQATVTESFLKQ